MLIFCPVYLAQKKYDLAHKTNHFLYQAVEKMYVINKKIAKKTPFIWFSHCWPPVDKKNFTIKHLCEISHHFLILCNRLCNT